MSHPNACGVRSAVERVFGSIFRHFRLVARKLRCAKNVAPATVLDTLHEGETERIGTPKTEENRAVSPCKIASGTVRATQNHARSAWVERRNASKAPPGLPKIFVVRTNEPTSSERACLESPKSARGPKNPRGNFGIFEWIFVLIQDLVGLWVRTEKS